MPRVSRLAKNRIGWTEDQRMALGTGMFLFAFEDPPDRLGGKPGRESQTAMAKARQCWLDIGAEVLAEWIAAHPGTRPWAWWKWNAPERRRCISGVHPFDDPDRKAHVARIAKTPGAGQQYIDRVHELRFGKPNAYVIDGDWVAEYEEERDYLARLDLLTLDERAALAEQITPNGAH